jgi:hypothetical protein
MRCVSAISPTASVEPVSWYTWYASATSAISVPMKEMPWPNHRRRKSR